MATSEWRMEAADTNELEPVAIPDAYSSAQPLSHPPHVNARVMEFVTRWDARRICFKGI
ncbi:hypothetical protein PLEOSDRAFT_160838 [Pleurotus ostreatus PC15]|uniref:Uncharacterized protein n=1 Tax=Pleurotus ostreatus (strain PC15) TaxID=1137138 RepID=A0A067NRL5_PLEO1|nr:hypothetical protein PLEOSDRAFT_160838 [Pleurotus ostreatus PC15]